MKPIRNNSTIISHEDDKTIRQQIKEFLPLLGLFIIILFLYVFVTAYTASAVTTTIASVLTSLKEPSILCKLLKNGDSMLNSINYGKFTVEFFESFIPSASHS